MGEWNHARILSQGKHVEFWLNGEKTVEFDRGSATFRETVELSKFKNIPILVNGRTATFCCKNMGARSPLAT